MIGTRIRYYRKRSGYTLEQLADGICSVSYLSKFEHGEKASDEIIQLLCKRLGISYEDVDNKEELDRINRLLDEWYEEIKDRNIEKSKKSKENVSELIKNIEHPNLLLKYELMKFRMALFSNNLTLADELLKTIETFKDLFINELNYYYLHFKGVYLYLNENYQATIECFEKAESLLNDLTLSDSEKAELYYQISLTSAQYYLINKCLEYAQKALTLFEKDYNLKRMADCHTLLGISNRRLNNFENAVTFYEQSLKFADLYQDVERQAIVFHNLGYVESCMDNHEKAIEYMEKSYLLSNEKDSKNLCLTIYLLAKEYFTIGDKNKTQNLIDEGLSLSKKIEILDSYYDFIILDIKLNKKEGLEDTLRKQAIPYSKKNNKWDQVLEYSEELANLYFNKAKYKQASVYYRLAIEARKKIS